MAGHRRTQILQGLFAGQLLNRGTVLLQWNELQMFMRLASTTHVSTYEDERSVSRDIKMLSELIRTVVESEEPPSSFLCGHKE